MRRNGREMAEIDWLRLIVGWGMKREVRNLRNNFSLWVVLKAQQHQNSLLIHSWKNRLQMGKNSKQKRENGYRMKIKSTGQVL